VTIAATTAVPGAAAVPLSRVRRAAIWTLIVLASLIGFASALSQWVDRQMLDNTAWEKASGQVIRDPKVRDALSVYLVNQLYDNVNVAESIGNRLPPTLQPLAAPAAAALRQPATNSVNFLLARPRAQQTFIAASSAAHQRLLNVLENKTGFGVSTGNGVVTVDLTALITQLGRDLGLPAAALAKLPPDAGTITVMRSDQLSAAQTAVQTIRVLSVWLLVAALGIFALAVYLARGVRRETIRNIGWAFVLVGLVLLVVRRVAGNYAIDALTAPAYRPPAHSVWLIMSATLGQFGWGAIFYGIITVAAAVLAGPTRAGTSVRRWLAPTLNKRPGITWAVAGGAFLLLVLWGGTPALRIWWEVLILAALLAAGVAALRRQTLREFPAAAPGEAGLSIRRAVNATPRRGQTSQTAKRSAAEEIARLRELHDAGAISDAEFDRGKQIALVG
jgi:hypothetical protein